MLIVAYAKIIMASIDTVTTGQAGLTEREWHSAPLAFSTHLSYEARSAPMPDAEVTGVGGWVKDEGQ